MPMLFRLDYIEDHPGKPFPHILQIGYDDTTVPEVVAHSGWLWQCDAFLEFVIASDLTTGSWKPVDLYGGRFAFANKTDAMRVKLTWQPKV